MIVIYKTGLNTVALTLGENTNVSSPVYIFTANEKATNVNVEFTLDVVKSNERWDICQIDGNLFDGNQYTYQVTEQTENKIVERGLLVAVSDALKGWDSYVEYDNADEQTRGRKT